MTKSPLKIKKGTETNDTSAPKSNLGRHDENGRELPDCRPMEPPVGYVESPSIAEMIQRMVSSAVIRQQLQEQGNETFEEANDLNIDDDPIDPSSPYEQHYYEETTLEELAALERSKQPLHDVQPAPLLAPSGGTGGVSPPVPSPLPTAPDTGKK